MIAYEAPAYVLFLQTVQEPDIEAASRLCPLPKHYIGLLSLRDRTKKTNCSWLVKNLLSKCGEEIALNFPAFSTTISLKLARRLIP
jgi:hypothetical protein